MPETVHVDLGERSYDIDIGPGVWGELGDRLGRLPRVSSLALVADATVLDLHGQAVREALQPTGLPVSEHAFPAGEIHKNLATVSGMLDELLTREPPIDRQTVVVALGGGVAGDLAGFTAAIALRGLRFWQCPTTLLAAVDASVGGKTGVDHPAGKNLIGAFHQPAGVTIDVRALATLPGEQVQSGLAECVKHAVIRDESLLTFIEDGAEDLLACRAEVMTDLVARNVAIKAEVVADDEREAGRRAHLNFGHTVGHAIETLVGLGSMSHGQAVALGMVAAGHLAWRRGLIGEGDLRRIERILTRLGLATRRAGLTIESVWQLMLRDKKARGGKVRMVLPTRLGAVEVFDDTRAEEVAEALRYLAGPAERPAEEVPRP